MVRPGVLMNTILTMTGIFFFGFVLFVAALRLCKLQGRRQEGEISRGENLRRETGDRRTNRGRLFIGMFVPESETYNRRQNRFGLEKSVVENLPTFTFKQGSEKLESKANLECSVCLNEFTEGEKGRILPHCGHFFHAECVDMWFFSHKTCPLCRSHVSSTPTTMPATCPAAGPRVSTTAAENRTQHSTGERPLSQPYVDLEIGANRRGPQTRETAGRRQPEDGRSANHPSFAGPTPSAEGIEDRTTVTASMLNESTDAHASIKLTGRADFRVAGSSSTCIERPSDGAE